MERSICIVTTELAGLDHNGGIGTYCLALAKALAGNSASVEILYAGAARNSPKLATVSSGLRRFGIALTVLADDSDSHKRAAQSYRAMKYLEKIRPDIAIFGDSNALGYYSQLAKRTCSSQLSEIAMCVIAHGSTEWGNAANETPLRTNDGVITYEMERRSVELADLLVCPSNYILEEYKNNGWSLPDNTIVLPNTVLFDTSSDRSPVVPKGDGIAFFGRLETRKGLWVFCTALDRLRGELAGKTVTFLGKPVLENGVSTEKQILQRSASWPCDVRLLTTYDTKGALAFLRRSAQVAVFPSDRDNNPSVILECMSQGIPFIGCSGGGNLELVDPKDRDKISFGRGARALADKLSDVFKNGCKRVRPSFTPGSARQAYLKTLNAKLLETVVKRRGKPSRKAEPETICYVLLSARQHGIEATVASILRIKRENGSDADVVVVSEQPEKLEKSLRRLELDATIVDANCTLSDLAAAADTKKSIVAISDSSQVLPMQYFRRASMVFAVDASISGLTGMVAATDSGSGNSEEIQGRAAKRDYVENYVYSSSSMLLSISQNQNAGFIVLPPGKLQELPSVGLMHAPSGRLKPANDLVHEVICELAAQDQCVEPIPDILVPTASSKEHSPTFTMGEVMRSTIKRNYGYQPGSTGELLGRMAIEVAIGGMREKSLRDFMSDLQQSVDDKFPEGHKIGSGDLQELLVLANAAGHGDAANEMFLSQALSDFSYDADFEEFIHSVALTISLFDRAKSETGCQTTNLTHEYSYRLWNDDRAIQLHPNDQHEGRASLEFEALDLREIGTFHSKVYLPMQAAHPVRLRVDILPSDAEACHTQECILASGEQRNWTFELPEDMADNSRIILSVEMVDPSAEIANAHVIWQDPVLRPKKPKEGSDG
ncbi:glycosyltransferase family 4 protein [Hoeflea sp. TYP-13]|uniref:glycosyltransferase family 4 protein n=1 Tax=Hoeflea sp. TYP-13 TaxID=3230023 RepID=UPI0034C6539F